MAQSKILVDTNAYLRLAKSISPLLCIPFGEEEYCLYVIPELNGELTSRKLKNRFAWIDDPEHTTNRNSFLALSRKEQRAIKDTFDYVWGYVETELPGPSRVDAKYIAYALELDIPVVTDDEDMIELANAFNASVMRTLELLKLMVDANHIDMQKANAIVSYWKYIDDAPGRLANSIGEYSGKRSLKPFCHSE